MGVRVAVAGATGAVGREMLRTLAERQFPCDEIFALASAKSAGKELSYGDDKTVTVQSLDKFDFAQADIALFSAGGDTSKAVAPTAGEAGCIVIDNSSAFRMDEDVPLIVPEVNPDAAKNCLKANGGRNIIANPNCSTAQLVVALKPLHDSYGVKRVIVSTYQATSGAGAAGMDELFNQTKGVFVHDEIKPEKFTKQIAFNAIPHIDVFMDDGFTKEEWKMTAETKKILDPKIELAAHCVRIPVFIGHSEAVFIETDKPIDEAEARELLRDAPGVSVIDHRANEGYVTPIEAAGEDAVYISRLRRDPTVENGLVFWCVSDNLRKGAALNSVQIAELVVRQSLSGR
ncbi:MAG: aspartate-semialdehyde dehydrogenase [Candidatus Puniceispirillaceae bacterium]|jgi:aspartate-semialdehyde dehydrogenase